MIGIKGESRRSYEEQNNLYQLSLTTYNNPVRYEQTSLPMVMWHSQDVKLNRQTSDPALSVTLNTPSTS